MEHQARDFYRKRPVFRSSLLHVDGNAATPAKEAPCAKDKVGILDIHECVRSDLGETRIRPLGNSSMDPLINEGVRHIVHDDVDRKLLAINAFLLRRNLVATWWRPGGF